jgi:hypothetical protein
LHGWEGRLGDSPVAAALGVEVPNVEGHHAGYHRSRCEARGVDPGVDRLVRQSPPRIVGKIELAAAGDLVGRPTLAQASDHVLAHLWLVHLAALRPRWATALVGAALGIDALAIWACE